jgi:hypothetical protein
MRFVIIYKNRDDVRVNIERHVPGFISRGADFAGQPITLPFFETRPYWPYTNEINALPFSTQVEEVDWNGVQLISIRKLIIDIDVVVSVPAPEE